MIVDQWLYLMLNIDIKNVITIGDIQAFIQYVKNFTQPIQQIAQVINQVQSMTAASERVFEFLEEEEEDQEHEGAVSVENVTGEVKFFHLNFGYNPIRRLSMIFL